MRIAYVCADSGVPVFGTKGCSIHAQEVVRAFLNRGHQVEIFATRTGGAAPDGLESVEVHELPGRAKNETATFSEAGPMNAALCGMLEQKGPFDLVYERYSLWCCAGMEQARTLGVPGLLEVNAPLIEEQAEHRGLADRAGAQEAAERVFRAAAAVLPVSREVAAYVRGYTGARGRVHVIPNGVDPRRFPPDLKPSCPAPPDTFTVGFVGTLKPWHGLPVLVEAFSELCRLGSTRLLIVGDGPERTYLMDQIAKRRLARAIHFAGAVPPEQVPGLMASMNAAVAPYTAAPHTDGVRFYFSPLKVYEYMAAGLPVVASRLGQLASLIQDGVNGLLCPPGDPSALTAALLRLRQDRQLCLQLGNAARRTVKRNHTWDAVAGRILGIAGSLTGVRA